MFDVVAIGELLIDFTPGGSEKNGNPCFEMNPGGAPGNCVSAVVRLGGKGAFIGMVGKDFFGDFLVDYLTKRGVDTVGVKRMEGIPTTLAFVQLNKNGERNFVFVRKPGADIMLDKKDVELSLIDQAKMVCFGSVALTDAPSRDAVFFAMDYAKQKNKLIAYDPNYRPMLWESPKEAVAIMAEGLKYADIVKLSDEEMELLTGYSADQLADGAKSILDTGKKAVFITAGPKGAYYASKDEAGFIPGHTIDVVDTTGCGDAFFGAVLYQMCNMPDAGIKQIAERANIAGALCAMKRGGIPALPDMDAIEQFEKRINTI